MKNNNSLNETFMNNLNFYMNKQNISQIELAEKLSVTPPAVHKWMRGISIPRMNKIDKICEILEIRRSDLLQPHDSNKTNEAYIASSPNAVRIPVYGEIAGGVPMSAIEQGIDPDDPDTWEEIPKSWLNGDKEIVALRVHGDSMEPRICDGDIAILERCYEWHNGAVMAVYVNGYNATLKKVKIEPNGILLLVPFNPAHETSSYTPEEQETLPVKPYGVLVELRAKF